MTLLSQNLSISRFGDDNLEQEDVLPPTFPNASSKAAMDVRCDFRFELKQLKSVVRKTSRTRAARSLACNALLASAIGDTSCACAVPSLLLPEDEDDEDAVFAHRSFAVVVSTGCPATHPASALRYPSPTWVAGLGVFNLFKDSGSMIAIVGLRMR